MDYRCIRLELSENVATITFNRPQVLNAFSPQMVTELLHALDRLAGEERARVLVLTGAGRAFCSGADLSGENVNAATNVLDTYYNPLIEKLYELPMPIISAVNGIAAGL